MLATLTGPLTPALTRLCRERQLAAHLGFLEGVYLDRTDQGCKPCFVKGEPPSNTDIAAVLQKISRRVIRTLRRLGYLEAKIDAARATGDDPLRREEPALARTMAASVKQRIYAGCLALHSKLRDAIIPTPRQQGVDGDEAKTGTPSWNWARLLGRVFNLDMATCSLCRRGALRIIAAMTQESVITRILRHLKLASVPSPIAPARCRQEIFAWVD